MKKRDAWAVLTVGFSLILTSCASSTLTLDGALDRIKSSGLTCDEPDVYSDKTEGGQRYSTLSCSDDAGDQYYVTVYPDAAGLEKANKEYCAQFLSSDGDGNGDVLEFLDGENWTVFSDSELVTTDRLKSALGGTKTDSLKLCGI